MANTKTYTVNDVMAILRISRTKAYELVNAECFPVIHIGKAIRIPVEPFERWMLSQYQQKCQYPVESITNCTASAV